ncbi:MAG: DUF3795 domain-containing protein [Thermodesulfobacteriota bacterium]|nr:DUF3795 domain-containing protein [Thermodesulfobacteriota bacterium]
MISYCGLYCRDCPNYKGEIADLARDLRKKLREAKLDRVSKGLSNYFKEFQEYDTCYGVLGAMIRLRCKRGCEDGGGNPNCKIRRCSLKKDITGCWECDTFETCEKFGMLRPTHGEACLKNLKRIKKKGQDRFLEGKRDWYV